MPYKIENITIKYLNFGSADAMKYIRRKEMDEFIKTKDQQVVKLLDDKENTFSSIHTGRSAAE
jgi:hypothetical protein